MYIGVHILHCTYNHEYRSTYRYISRSTYMSTYMYTYMSTCRVTIPIVSAQSSVDNNATFNTKVRLFVSNIGYILTLTPLLAKTWRIHKVLTGSKTMQKVVSLKVY